MNVVSFYQVCSSRELWLKHLPDVPAADSRSPLNLQQSDATGKLNIITQSQGPTALYGTICGVSKWKHSFEEDRNFSHFFFHIPFQNKTMKTSVPFCMWKTKHRERNWGSRSKMTKLIKVGVTIWTLEAWYPTVLPCHEDWKSRVVSERAEEHLSGLNSPFRGPAM